MLVLFRLFDTGARILAHDSNYVCSLMHAPNALCMKWMNNKSLLSLHVFYISFWAVENYFCDYWQGKNMICDLHKKYSLCRCENTGISLDHFVFVDTGACDDR